MLRNGLCAQTDIGTEGGWEWRTGRNIVQEARYVVTPPTTTPPTPHPHPGRRRDRGRRRKCGRRRRVEAEGCWVGGARTRQLGGGARSGRFGGCGVRRVVGPAQRRRAIAIAGGRRPAPAPVPIFHHPLPPSLPALLFCRPRKKKQQRDPRRVLIPKPHAPVLTYCIVVPPTLPPSPPVV